MIKQSIEQLIEYILFLTYKTATVIEQGVAAAITYIDLQKTFDIVGHKVFINGLFPWGNEKV